MDKQESPAAVLELTPVTHMAAHEADKARRAAEQEKKRPELMRCLSPAYAAKKELEKPNWRWTVSAKWLGQGDDGKLCKLESEQVVVAQTESDAWAMFCDKIGTYPSRREAKPIIKRGRQVSVESIVAEAAAHADADEELPTVKIGPKPKPRATGF